MVMKAEEERGEARARARNRTWGKARRDRAARGDGDGDEGKARGGEGAGREKRRRRRCTALDESDGEGGTRRRSAERRGVRTAARCKTDDHTEKRRRVHGSTKNTELRKRSGKGDQKMGEQELSRSALYTFRTMYLQ
jgi:ribonuclease E